MENQTNTLFVNQSLLKMLFDIKKVFFRVDKMELIAYNATISCIKSIVKLLVTLFLSCYNGHKNREQ